jgi:predicted AAA+ superfamily ATPase
MPRRYDREFKLEPPLIIDEAQTLPELFPALRSMIDLDRPQNGRYILLRSVNPALVEQISESLAGRVGIDEDVIHKGLVIYGRQKLSGDGKNPCCSWRTGVDPIAA